MSRRKRKGSKSGQFSAGDPPLPASHSSAPSPASPGPGTPGSAPPPAGMSRNGWIIIGVVIVLVVAAAIYFYGGDAAHSGDNPVVVMETSMGTMKIELYASKAPKTVENFLKYVDDKHYDGTIFHRVIPNFMIQGGGFGPGLVPRGEKYSPVRNEASTSLPNERGTIAMARTDNPHSATDQFFINVADNTKKLGPNPPSAGYAVFGKVISGIEVADKIRAVETGEQGGHEDVPRQDVIIKSIRRQGAN